MTNVRSTHLITLAHSVDDGLQEIIHFPLLPAELSVEKSDGFRAITLVYHKGALDNSTHCLRASRSGSPHLNGSSELSTVG